MFRKGLVVVLLSVFVAVLAAGCSASAAGQSSTSLKPLSTMQSDNALLTEEKMMSLEQQWASEAGSSGINIVKTSEEDKARIRASLEQEIAFNNVNFPLAEGTMQLAGIVGNAIDNGINVPNVLVAPDVLQKYIDGFNTAVGQGKQVATIGWLKSFHWTNHMRHMGVDSLNLRQAGQVLYSIVKGAATDGIIMQNGDRFMFIARLNIGGNVKTWATIIAQNGNPVTGYDTENATVVKYAVRMASKQGWQEITQSQLPQAIKDNWQKGAPPIIRYVWWALKFQLEVHARAAGMGLQQYLMQNGAIFTHAPWWGLIVPACILEPPTSLNRCGGSGDKA